MVYTLKPRSPDVFPLEMLVEGPAMREGPAAVDMVDGVERELPRAASSRPNTLARIQELAEFLMMRSK